MGNERIGAWLSGGISSFNTSDVDFTVLAGKRSKFASTLAS